MTQPSLTAAASTSILDGKSVLIRPTCDLGDVLVIWPEFQFHTTLSGVRPGTPVPDDFVYSSDRAEPRLDLAATRAMLERVA